VNRRLRKKTHRSEYSIWGRRVVVTRDRDDGFDAFLDAFIIEAIEASGCTCGGGGKGSKLDVVVELGRRADDREARCKRITDWLDARDDVSSWQVSDESDLWYGDSAELEDGRLRDPTR
jgi:uncharacterized protein YggL (DUF469 family)